MALTGESSLCSPHLLFHFLTTNHLSRSHRSLRLMLTLMSSRERHRRLIYRVMCFEGIYRLALAPVTVFATPSIFQQHKIKTKCMIKHPHMSWIISRSLFQTITKYFKIF